MDFIILKVNGVDVSGCSHDEAVEVLTRASEPIMVQVKHRQSSDAESPEVGARSSSAETPGSQCSREIQTETDVICDHCGEFYGCTSTTIPGCTSTILSYGTTTLPCST